MFLKNVSGQHIGFCLISQASGQGMPGLAVLSWVSKDGSHPASPGLGTVRDGGNGQYDYQPTQGESNCDELSVILTAPLCVPQEKTVYPFDAALPILGVLVEQTPSGPNFGPVSILTVQNSDGLLWANLGGGRARLRLQNASIIQTGSVNTVAQTFKGQKTFADGVTVSPGTGGIPGIVLDTAPSGSTAASIFANDATKALQIVTGTGLARTFLTLTSYAIGDGWIQTAAYDTFGVQQRAGFASSDGTGVFIGGWDTLNGVTFAGGLYVSGTLTGIGVDQGGTGSDLSGTGPGVLYQPGAGSPVTIVPPGTSGNVLTSNGSDWQSTPASGSAPTIGMPVVGATAQQLLYVDGSGNLANVPQMQYTGFPLFTGQAGSPAGRFEDSTGAYTAHFADTFGIGAIFAARFSDGTHSVILCDGTNTITYVPGGASVWGSPTPTDVWNALDRISAWIAFNFGGLAPP